MSVKKSFVLSAVLMSLTVGSSLILSSSRALADDSVVDVVRITVPVSCSLTSTGNTSHTSSINNGTYVADIGTTYLEVYCNDEDGFSIYAVGYTDNEYGKTVLTSSLGSSNDIVTGTATAAGSTDVSNWAMKLTTTTSPTPEFPITIENSFDAYHVVPAAYTLVASRASGTDVGQSAVGSYLTSTYAVYVSKRQPSATYTGKVKYTLVHPATNVPNSPQTTNAGYIGYFPNAGNLVEDTMGNQSVGASDTFATLWASNFKRPGYGFAGWSDAFDYVIGEGSESNPNAHIYGPNEDIEFTAGQYNSPNTGLSLYAVWVPSAGSLQSWTCPNNTAMPVGTVTALTDQRDNNTYAVAKLADGKCWMIENLRLDNTNSDNATGALAQGYGTSATYGNFIGLANPETANFNNTNPPVANTLYKSDGSGDIKGVNGATQTDIGTTSYPYSRIPRFRNDNTNTNTTLNPNITTNNMADTNQNIYSYGNYYSWPAAKANTDYLDTLADSNAINTSICPKGWRLPQGGDKANESTNEFWSLIVTGLNNGGNPANYDSSTQPYYTGAEEAGPVDKKLRTFPNNFVYSGYVADSSVYSRGSVGNYWSATARSFSGAYLFYFYRSSVRPGTYYNDKYLGRSVRCVLTPSV